MRKEVERCRLAFETAAEGKQVAMICSGDAGVYGMAGLMYELSEEWPDIEIKVIPGVTAATGGAAVLGAPLIHDFALISLSDLLTPWEKIEKRLLLASEADFVICLYNPGMGVRSFPALFYIHLHTIPMESPEILQYFLEQMLNYAAYQ